MEPIKANIGTSDNLANLKNWQDMFGELAKGYIDPAEPRKLAPGQSWGAGIGKLVHKYAFDMPASIVVNAAKLFDKGSKDPLSVAPLEYTSTVADALLAATPGGGTGVANIGKRDALRNLGRSGVRLAKDLRLGIYKEADSHAPNSALRSHLFGLGARKYKEFIKNNKTALRSLAKLPQKELDRINDIAWERPRTSEFGSYSPGDKKVNLTQVLMQDLEKETSDTLFHEFTHARQWTPDKSLSEMVKARALRKASKDMPYKAQPIEQLARATAHDLLDGTYANFDEAYKSTLDGYLRAAKDAEIDFLDEFATEMPTTEHWKKLAPHLREGLELAKKVPTAKKQISKLSKIAAKADEIKKGLAARKAPPALQNRADRIRSAANRQQVQYHQILQEFGIE